MKKSILTMAAALAFSLCASAQTQYVMQIKKNNGDIVRMNADDVQASRSSQQPCQTAQH